MKNLLEDFWYGNIIPHEQFIGNTPEIKKLNDYILRHRETLHESMTPEQKAIFEKYPEKKQLFDKYGITIDELDKIDNGNPMLGYLELVKLLEHVYVNDLMLYGDTANGKSFVLG